MPLYLERSWDEIRLSSRILDRAIRVPGCSRAVSKWISRSRECESTCIIASGMRFRACTRGFPCKCACYPSLYKRVVDFYRMVTAARFPWLIVTLFTPICRFMAPPLGTGLLDAAGALQFCGTTGGTPRYHLIGRWGDSCPLSRPSL